METHSLRNQFKMFLLQQSPCLQSPFTLFNKMHQAFWQGDFSPIDPSCPSLWLIKGRRFTQQKGSEPSSLQRPVLAKASWEYKTIPPLFLGGLTFSFKWVRGESQKQCALTTCDPHLNSFQHDISLNQAYKRLHCAVECALGWTRVIEQPDRTQKKKRSKKRAEVFIPQSMEMAH